MSQVLAALLGAIITAFFSGVILESYKRHRDLQGVASAIAGEIYSLIHIVEKRQTAAHFARLLAELEAGRDVDWTDVTGGDPAQDDPVVKSHLERLGSLPRNIPERIATFYTYLRGIRIDIQNLSRGVFKDQRTQAFIIRADLLLWADAAQLGTSLWTDLRQVATSSMVASIPVEAISGGKWSLVSAGASRNPQDHGQDSRHSQLIPRDWRRCQPKSPTPRSSSTIERRSLA